MLKLKQIFPEVCREDQIDSEKLKLVLGTESLVGVGDVINSILQKLIVLFTVSPGKY